jgi:hypothetical protein
VQTSTTRCSREAWHAEYSIIAKNTRDFITPIFDKFDKSPSLVNGHITRTRRSDCAYLPSGSSTPPLVTLTPSCTPPSAFPLVPRHSFRRFSVLSISHHHRLRLLPRLIVFLSPIDFRNTSVGTQALNTGSPEPFPRPPDGNPTSAHTDTPQPRCDLP